jgi:hypothetical protein
MPPIESFSDLTRRDREIVLDVAVRFAGENPTDQRISKSLMQAFQVATFVLHPSEPDADEDETTH